MPSCSFGNFHQKTLSGDILITKKFVSYDTDKGLFTKIP